MQPPAALAAKVQPERGRGRLPLLPLLTIHAPARARPHAPPVSEGAPPSRPHHFAACTPTLRVDFGG